MGKFRDYQEDLIFNKSKDCSFAIELEIGLTFYEKEIEWLHSNRIRESSNIMELRDLHLRDKKTISKVYKKCQEYYKDKFPLWANGHNSWGVHFHVFWDFDIFEDTSINKFNSLLINCPFFMKLYNWSFYNRQNRMHRFEDYRDVEDNSKGLCVTCNSVGSFEFRCNNVIDGRLLGYYQWVLLAAKKKIKFEKVSNKIETYSKRWDTKGYWQRNEGNHSILKWTKYEDWVTDIPIEDCEGIKVSQEDKGIILRNVEIIVSLLKEEGLTNSSKAFGEYLDEFNF